MIPRAHGLILSILIGAASAAGAYAMIGTAKLGEAQTKPDVVSSRQIAARASKLDAWEASLRKALATKPPALTPLNRYASVAVVSAPGHASIPAVATVGPRAAGGTRAPAKKPRTARSRVKSHVVSAAAPARGPDTREPDAPAVEAGPERSVPAPTPTFVAAAAPPPTSSGETKGTPSTTQAPPTSQSVEKQCEALKQAAESKGEQAKKNAETQCEALKQAAEHAREQEKD